MVSESQTVSGFIVDENKGRDTIIKENVKPEGACCHGKSEDFCNECGGEMGIPGLMDYNMKEIDEQYRSFRALDG